MKALPDGARLERGRGDLERLVLATAEAEAQLYLSGAHLTHFQARGEKPVLWLSERSHYAPGKPIRGGVPVCFPWFGPKAGDAAAPIHGFARLLPWRLASVEKATAGGLVAELVLRSDDATLPLFPHPFRLRFAVTTGRRLHMVLTVENPSDQPLRCEEALHTYFAVGDARRLAITGLEGTGYLDKADAGARKTLGAGPLTIAGHTDRVFGGHSGPIAIEDAAWARRIVITRTGSRTAVVWNPWQAKAKAMPDFGDDEWTAMACVESANALEDALTLVPGASHTLSTTIDTHPI